MCTLQYTVVGYKEPSINSFSVPISRFGTLLYFDSHFHLWMGSANNFNNEIFIKTLHMSKRKEFVLLLINILKVLSEYKEMFFFRK